MNKNTLHRLLLPLILLLLLPVSAMALNQGESLIPFTAQDMDGGSIDLASVIGQKPVMLVFWASWCPNCKSEVPKIKALVDKYGEKGMTFIGINVGHNDSVAKARRFMKKTGMTYPVIFDQKGDISRKYAIQGVPTVLVADKKGTVVFKNYGVPKITDDDFLHLSQ